MKIGTSINRMLPMASLSLSVGISEDQTSLMVDEASAAMEELIRLAHAEEPLWKKSENGRGETLDLENYSTVFSRVRDPNLREEGTRATCVAMTAAEFLVEALMDTVRISSDLIFSLFFNGRVSIAVTLFLFRTSGWSSSLRLSLRQGPLKFFQMELEEEMAL